MNPRVPPLRDLNAPPANRVIEHDRRRAIDAQISADDYFDDVNGLPAYRRHTTHYFAQQIRAELAQPGT